MADEIIETIEADQRVARRLPKPYQMQLSKSVLSYLAEVSEENEAGDELNCKRDGTIDCGIPVSGMEADDRAVLFALSKKYFKIAYEAMTQPPVDPVEPST